MPNDPGSTSSNYNMSKSSLNSTRLPRRNKKAPFTKKPKAAKKVVVDNKQSQMINRLSKQIYHLEMSKYGKVQQNYHTLRSVINPTGAAPCCLDLTDFTCSRPTGPSGATGAGVYQHAGATNPQVTNWSIVPYSNNIYWENQNSDQPDTGSYLAMNATYFVEVKGVNALDNTRIRFDVISQRAEALALDNFDAAVLPETLGYMKHLAQPMGAASNRINPTFFKKYFTKTVFINSSKTDQYSKGTTANIMRFSFKIKPNKVCTQRVTRPTIGSLDPAAEVNNGNFGPENVHPTQPLWLVISTDDLSSIGDAVSVDISRRIVWRDTIGAAVF